jgi:hypothetical protein
LWKTYYHICNRTGATDGAGSVYPSGRLITTFVTGQVPLMEQEALTILEEVFQKGKHFLLHQ